MKQQNPQQKIQKMIRIGRFAVPESPVAWLCLALIAAVIGFALYNSSPFSPRNYAAEMAQPLGDALVKAGAVKKCERGDNGRSVSNTVPWTQSFYEIPMNEKAAIATVREIAEANGYKLTHATPKNKGHLQDIVGDEHIDKWYFDDSKDSVNTDLKAGKIELDIAVNNRGDKDACEGNPITVDATHSVVAIGVKLPSVIR